MSTLRYIQHAIILLYIGICVMAFGYTMLRIRTDFLWPIVRFEYMMMAPYQSYTKFSNELTVAGRREGTWEEIDLAPYFPVLLGERSIREFNLYRGISFHDDRRAQYERLAALILLLEKKRGRTYDQLVLEWWRWPASPDTYRTLKKRIFSDVELLYRTP